MDKLDIRDVFVLVGLLLLGGGLWLKAPWIALSVDGMLLFLIGIISIIKK